MDYGKSGGIWNKELGGCVMKITYLVLGPFMTNTYIAWDEETKHAVVIDPSFTPENIWRAIIKLGVTPLKILLTHAHVDHMAGLNFLREKYPDAKVYMSGHDVPYLTDAAKNLSYMLDEPVRCAKPDVLVKEGDHITVDTMDFEVLDTPGHTPGGISFYCKKERLVFTGDALFQGSVGRTDFPGGSMTTLIESIRKELFTLPDDTYVLSGHGNPTTIGDEKASNPFVQGV